MEQRSLLGSDKGGCIGCFVGGGPNTPVANLVRVEGKDEGLSRKKRRAWPQTSLKDLTLYGVGFPQHGGGVSKRQFSLIDW